MTFEVQQNRWDQTIRRASGSIGPGSRVAETLAELFPTFDVENLPLELMLTAGWTLGQGVTDQTAVVGQFSKGQLFNPADSGKLIVVERIDLFSNTTQVIEYSLAETPLTTSVGNIVARDTREGIIGAGVGQARQETSVSSLVQFGMFIVNVNENFPFFMERGLFVLAPDSGITFGCQAADKNLVVNFMWRERVALQSELQF